MAEEGKDSRMAMDPADFAALVRDATDEQLEEGIAANRTAILEQIFEAMPARLNPARVARMSAVVDWEISGLGGGGVDRYRVVIRDGRCAVMREGDEPADVTFRLGPVDFVKLVGGRVSGPELFLFGRLEIRGNLMLAARMPSLFSIPRAKDD